MAEPEDRLRMLESEIERRLLERFAGLRDEFDRLRVESDRRWAGFLSRFEQDFTGLVPPELVNPPAPAPDASALPDRPAGSGLLSIEVARNLDDAGNQVEALHRFLELCRRHASRAALLISKSGSFVVWKATGFSESGGNDEATRRVTLPMDGGPLAKVIEGSAYALGPGNDISARLGATDVGSAVLVPMVVKEKVSGAVYADCTAADASRFDPESIAFLTFLAGLFVDRLAGRKLKPAPALRPLQEPGAVSAAASPVMTGETREPSSEDLPARPTNRESFGTKMLSHAEMSAPEPSPSAPPPSAPPVLQPPSASAPRISEPDFAIPAPAPEPEPASEPAAEPEPRPAETESEPSLAYEPEEPAPMSPPRRAEPAAPFPAPPRPAPPAVRPAAAAPAPAPAASAAPADTSVRPSTGARRLAGPLAPLEGDERREEARRFAKLLVSEIKLYNEKAVLDGRAHGDLYDRLKEDIDRSRQMYDERIPEDVRANTNFFYEELVRILADGRAEALGI